MRNKNNQAKQVAQEIVLLIGGPGSGKTTLLNHLATLGYTCYEEISRQVTLEAQKQGIEQFFLKDPLLFSQKLLEGRIEQHINAQKDSSEVVIIDRGIPDVLAYMDFIGDNYPDSFTEACLVHRYTKVFALPVWDEIYQSDNERYEDLQTAHRIQEHLIVSYIKYGYQPIYVPKMTIGERADFVINHL